MPIRDIVVSTIIFGSLPACFLRPWIGVLVWSWIGYMNPHRLSWGFATEMPFAQMVAIATMAGFLFSKERYPLPQTREVYLLLALWLVFLLSTLSAFYPVQAWRQFDKVSKILVMTFITLLLFQDQRKLKALLWVIALSLGFFGLKGGIWAVTTGGQNMVLGPPGSFIEGNTEIGMALNMVLPILFYLRKEETRPWLRHLLLAMFGFSIIAILITYSRGAFLGLAVVLSLLFLKSRAKFLALLLVAAAIPLATSTLPEKWFGRMETIGQYEKESSAMGRIMAWKVAYRIALDSPVLGAGFRTFTREMFQRYGYERGRDAHSIFFQVLGEHGFTGLALYVALILSTILSIRSLLRKSRGVPELQWVYNYSQMLEASVAAYIICGVFLSMSYFDLFYHLVAIVVILKKLVLVHERESAQARVRDWVRPTLVTATPTVRVYAGVGFVRPK